MSLAMCSLSLSHLSMKFISLVAITSTRQVSELAIMMADPAYSVFHKDKISLCLRPKFLPKVVLEFHLNQSIHLSIFHPKPHAIPPDRTLRSMVIYHALMFYLDMTYTFHTSS